MRRRRPLNLTVTDAVRAVLAGWRGSPSRYVEALILAQDRRWRAQWEGLAAAGHTAAAIEALMQAEDPGVAELVFEYTHGNPHLIALLPPVGIGRDE